MKERYSQSEDIFIWPVSLALIPTTWAILYHTDIPRKYILLTNQHYHAREWLSAIRHEKITFGPGQWRQYWICTVQRQYEAHMCIYGTFSLLKNWKLLIYSQIFFLCTWLLFEPASVHTNAVLIRKARLKTQRCLLQVLYRHEQTIRKNMQCLPKIPNNIQCLLKILNNIQCLLKIPNNIQWLLKITKNIQCCLKIPDAIQCRIKIPNFVQIRYVVSKNILDITIWCSLYWFCKK